MKKKKKQAVAVFDIDGTIFRSSLLIELTESLIQEGVFPVSTRKMYKSAYHKWFDRKGDYEKYIRAVVKAFEKNIVGVNESEFNAVAKKVLAFHKNRVYRYTRDLALCLKKKKYYLLAVSHSPRGIVYEFCRKLGFDKVYGRIYTVNSRGIFTGEVSYYELIEDKAKVLERAVRREGLTFSGSVGVGDTESDIPFLRLVEKPICFNPNRKLYCEARKRRWGIIIERKDVIYRLHPARRGKQSF
ncbi:MAG: hypothetical protein A3H69_02405 [Candidatus Sungbacteria bacterium RIFCSPLOWO2_02_FULL_47_9]|uniref:HAD-IB family hydrolase n=2 Tax=Parcubacteria group TaxID=1794811 RepID=A0A1G2RPV1_9BACT|nr:MAG: hypothetical protein UX72_C0003G0068 [Parcubacteria group bacterium GW2011_GWA2_47_10]OGZ94001.1 MAG: hypothetical protein A2633_00990 [Candidatus Sungbacteria bacterium RIFCSPHIGHO2_01_FULL_47_32]OHA11177.1 MAG: hypothetical protein A3H69_02405 [Candidatus Sungbacteria bacterium RIFCSPLOWO2_02_FULL_47_9]OHA74884.1 MAG: hypothetical protein A3A32_03485 [Candidatus Wildermuthbacteria bacterium RIFCSPLOWO2_01_FULL_48_35]